MILEFGQWLPDLPAHQNQGLVEAKNVIPQQGTYEPAYGLTSFTNALASACLGSFWMHASNGTIAVFAGDAAALYSLNVAGDTWSSKTTTPYSANNWSFTNFGDRVIACDLMTNPQYFDVGTSTNFADLPGSPPKAKYIGVVRDFVVLANINDGSSKPSTIAWSGFNNSELWVASLATQSDTQELLGRGGDIQGFVSGEEGIIFQEFAIRMMTYEGPPRVFRIDQVVEEEGTPSPNSIVRYGEQVFFYGHGGFKLFDGRGTRPIGVNRMERWFNTNLGDVESIQGAIDRQNRLVCWAFKTSTSLTHPDRILYYNYGSDNWSWSEVTVERIVEYVSPAGGFLIDNNPLVLDDSPLVFVDGITPGGGVLDIIGFDSSHQAATFSGTALTAQLDTREISVDEHRHETNSIRPIIEGGTGITTQIGYRDTLQDSVSYTAARSLNRIGEANIRKNARYQRYRISVDGDFTEAQGLDIRGRKAGRR